MLADDADVVGGGLVALHDHDVTLPQRGIRRQRTAEIALDGGFQHVPVGAARVADGIDRVAPYGLQRDQDETGTIQPVRGAPLVLPAHANE